MDSVVKLNYYDYFSSSLGFTTSCAPALPAVHSWIVEAAMAMPFPSALKDSVTV